MLRKTNLSKTETIDIGGTAAALSIGETLQHELNMAHAIYNRILMK